MGNVSEGKKLGILKRILGDWYRSHDEYLFYCPSCDHHKKKLSVNLAKNVFKCWICDYTGTSIRRLVRKHGNHTNLYEWSQLTEEREVGTLSADIFEEEVKDDAEQRIKLPDEFRSLTSAKPPISSRNAQLYLKKRGITKKDAIYWKLGYCPEGEYAGRIIVPSFGYDGYCNYFVARSYDGDWKKYMNPPASKDIIFNFLYLDFDSDLVLVEGIFDAIISGPNSVPLLGSTLKESSRLFQEIVKNDTTVYMALDPDASEKEDRIIKKFLNYGVEVYKVDISPYSDVGEMSKEEFRRRKIEAVPVEQGMEMLVKAIMAI